MEHCPRRSQSTSSIPESPFRPVQPSQRQQHPPSKKPMVIGLANVNTELKFRNVYYNITIRTYVDIRLRKKLN